MHPPATPRCVGVACARRRQATPTVPRQPPTPPGWCGEQTAQESNRTPSTPARPQRAWRSGRPPHAHRSDAPWHRHHYSKCGNQRWNAREPNPPRPAARRDAPPPQCPTRNHGEQPLPSCRQYRPNTSHNRRRFHSPLPAQARPRLRCREPTHRAENHHAWCSQNHETLPTDDAPGATIPATYHADRVPQTPTVLHVLLLS